jgi:4-carboxymuconolactone decarboxylase
MRTPRLRPESLDPAQRALYDRIAGGERALQAAVVAVVDGDGVLEGPFNALLLHPPVGTALQEVGRVLRYQGVLTDRCREIVVLTVAARQRSAYEWDAHARLGSVAGLDDDELTALARGSDDTFDEPGERVALQLATALAEGRHVDDELYTAAEQRLGAPGILEVSVLVGYYRLLAQQLDLFAVPAPPAPWDA